MSQSLAQIYVHLIFSTKNRAPVLTEPVCSDLAAYMGGVLRQIACPSLATGAAADHTHVLFRQSKNVALAAIVQEVKTGSSKWLKTRDKALASFHWQNGYSAFSVSASRLDAVRTYVVNQRAHHGEVSYQDELRALLRAHGVEFDERYVWD